MFKATDKRLAQLHKALGRLAKPHARYVSCAFFHDDEIKAMIDATADLPFRPAQKIVGNGVIQDMDVCFPAPRISVYDDCASLLEEGVNHWRYRADYLPQDIYLNDFAVQRYPLNSQGIGIHKDGLRYKMLVFIITLAGSSRLFYTNHRQGGKRYAINDTPGRLVILKAPQFKDMADDERILHGVDRLAGGRLSIGFRHEA